MRDPVAATYRKTGAATAEVGIHPRAGEGGRLLDQITTTVQLHRYTNGWVATGAKAVNAIEVEQPLPFSRIRSPLPVSGMSVAYEGTVHVTVTEDRRGADRVLGRTFVNGGADTLAPFRGQVRFTRPTGDAGWVVFTPDSGADLGIFTATAVRVRFVNSDHTPQILGVVTDPRPAASSQLVTLTGSGTFTVARQGLRRRGAPRAARAQRHRRPAPRQAARGRPQQRGRRALVGLLALPGPADPRPPAHPGQRPGRHGRARRDRRVPRLSTTTTQRGGAARLPSLLPLDMSERPLIGFGR